MVCIKPLRYAYSNFWQFLSSFLTHFRSLWPSLLTQDCQLKLGLSQFNKRPFCENCMKIGAIFWQEFCLLILNDRKTDTHTHIYIHWQTNCNENRKPSRFRRGEVKKICILLVLMCLSNKHRHTSAISFSA